MAFLDLHEGIAELFDSATLDERRESNKAREWFIRNRVGRHLYQPPVPPLQLEVSCIACRQPMRARAIGPHHYQAHQVKRARIVTCCVCRCAFTSVAMLFDHFAAKHQEVHVAASRIAHRIDRARRAA